MDDKELKAAEHRGYAKGYQAGRRRKDRALSTEAKQRKKDAFWQRAFLATLPAAFAATGWTRGEKPIADLSGRVKLAAETADEAMRHAIFHL